MLKSLNEEIVLEAQINRNIKVRRNNLTNREKIVLYLLFLVYSAFSRPIPANFGMPEIMLAFLLVILVLKTFLSEKATSPMRPQSTTVACVSLIVFPTILGLIINGNALLYFVRDFVPLLFILTPVFFYPRIKADPAAWRRTLEGCFMLSGLILSLRYVLTGEGVAFGDVYTSDLAPLNQCPTVIYSASACLISALISERRKIWLFYKAGVGMICLTTLMMSVMRAQIGLTVALLVTATAMTLSMKGLVRIAAIFLLLIAISQIFFSDQLSAVFNWTWEMISHKTQAAGIANSRDGEFKSIIESALSSPLSLLIGEGWGAQMYLPTAGYVVGFTHNGILYFLWKTGVVGLIIFGLLLRKAVFVATPFWSMSLLRKDYIATFFGFLAAIIIFGIVEMGYKMISFGFILCLGQAMFFSIQRNKQYGKRKNFISKYIEKN